MLRRILAGLVVAAFVLSCSFALAADSKDILTYQPVTVKGLQATQLKTQQAVQLFLENTEGLAAATIPLSFGKPGSDIRCTQVDFEGSRVEHFLHYVQINNDNKEVLIGVIRALNQDIKDELSPGQGLFATLTFESSKGYKPELNVTSWQLVGGKLHFHLVGSDAKIFYHEKIENKDAARPVPLKPGTSQESAAPRPSEFGLDQNYPNPFNPETVIKFSLPEDSKVTLRVYNLLGQLVTTLVDKPMSAGSHAVTWNGKNGQNQDVASGIYFYRIKADDYESVKRMTLLR